MSDQLDFGLAASGAPEGRDRPARRRRPAPVPRAAQMALPLPVKARVEVADAVVASETDSGSGSEARPVPEPTIRGKRRIEEIVRGVLGPRTMVTLTKNRSTMISCRHRRGVVYFRIHTIFEDAPEDVLRAAARYVTGQKTDAREDHLIDAYIDAHRDVVKRPAREAILQPHGEVHDLEAMFADLNQRYFEDRITARITWSRALKNQKRRSMRLGSYCDETKIIRIHPALDQAFVPAYFVASVVFHEMLHEVHGAPEHPSGRREVHTPAFNADERKFEDFERARKWEAKHLSRLLRY